MPNLLPNRDTNTNRSLYRWCCSLQWKTLTWYSAKDGVGETVTDIPAPAIDSRSRKVEYGKVWCLSQDRQGNIWIARDGLGACRFDGQSFTHFTKSEGLCSNNISNIIEDKEGNIWFSCLSSDHPNIVSEGGLNRFDGTSMIKFPETKGLFENDIYTIYPTRSGSVWIGATGVGAHRYDQNEFTVRPARPHFCCPFSASRSVL